MITNTLHIKNELGQLSLVSSFIEHEIEIAGINSECSMQIRLALEEVVTNVILYAYPSQSGQDLSIDVAYQDGKLQITVIDTGIPFNPMEMEDPDLTLSVDKRPIGGLGIFIAKRLMSEVHYCRTDGKNILTMVKNVD